MLLFACSTSHLGLQGNPKAGFRLLAVTTSKAQLPIPSMSIKETSDGERQRKEV